MAAMESRRAARTLREKKSPGSTKSVSVKKTPEGAGTADKDDAAPANALSPPMDDRTVQTDEQQEVGASVVDLDNTSLQWDHEESRGNALGDFSIASLDLSAVPFSSPPMRRERDPSAPLSSSR